MTTTVQQHERTIQHQRRRRVFTAAVAEDHEVVQGGVPRTPPRQFPDISPEAISRFENARRLKDKETQQRLREKKQKKQQEEKCTPHS